MKRVGTALLLAVAVLAPGASSQSLSLDSIYVHLDGRWESAPKAVSAPTKSAPAHLLFFQRGGMFIEHWCWLNLTNGKTGISAGDPHVVVVGTWRSLPTGTEVHRQRVFRTVQLIAAGGDPLCDNAIQTLSQEGPSVILNGERFTRRSDLPLADFLSWVSEANESSVRCGA